MHEFDVIAQFGNALNSAYQCLAREPTIDLVVGFLLVAANGSRRRREDSGKAGAVQKQTGERSIAIGSKAAALEVAPLTQRHRHVVHAAGQPAGVEKQDLPETGNPRIPLTERDPFNVAASQQFECDAGPPGERLDKEFWLEVVQFEQRRYVPREPTFGARITERRNNIRASALQRKGSSLTSPLSGQNASRDWIRCANCNRLLVGRWRNFLSCWADGQHQPASTVARPGRDIRPCRCYSEPIVAADSAGPAAVVFDGDDTLWSTEPLYDRARQGARAEVVNSGLDGDEWERAERRIDVENVRVFGFSVERFPASCVQAYEAVAQASGVPASHDVADRVRSAARAVFSQDPPLVPGALETLQRLRRRGAKLALLTKGDHDLQVQRVEHSGIADWFDVIRIVPEKPSQAFREIVVALGVAPIDAWSVGNSVRSDILPAIEAGLRAVWIDAHVWEHERFEGSFAHHHVIAVAEIAKVTDAIETALMEESLHGGD
jgi:putative hydrolase of the HAD superfamily